MRKSKRLYTLTMIAGTLLAVLMAFSQFVDLGNHLACAQQVTPSGETQEEPETSKTCVSMRTFSLPSSVHVRPDLDAHFLFEILFEPQTDAEYVVFDAEAPTRFLVTLFRVIISPNAP